MSEDEKKQRLGYRKRRQRLIMFQTTALAVVLAIAVIAAIFAVVLNKTYYINYSEKSSIDYGVVLKNNDFYEDGYLGGDYAYIASLIDKVQADFKYKLEMQSQDKIDFEYKYRVDAVVQIKNRASGKQLFAPVYPVVEEKSGKVTATGVSIVQSTSVDYGEYNEIATKFIDTYELDGVEANLLLMMHVDIVGESEEFHHDHNKNAYTSSVSIPLTTRTVEVKITSAIPKEEQQILSFTTENVANVFRTGAIIAIIFGVALAAVLTGYAYTSRNVDITYDIKVARLVRNYKSFIQKIRNHFDISENRVLFIDTFDEMLEIRDTIQSPILMDENDDRTLTRFIIPTNTELLYVHEIKVDDYDDIYGAKTETDDAAADELTAEEMPEPASAPAILIADPEEEFIESVKEEPILEKPIATEVKAEPIATLIDEEKTAKNIADKVVQIFAEKEKAERAAKSVEAAAAKKTEALAAQKTAAPAPKTAKKATEPKPAASPAPIQTPMPVSEGATPVVVREVHHHHIPVMPAAPIAPIVVTPAPAPADSGRKDDTDDDGSSVITMLIY